MPGKRGFGLSVATVDEPDKEKPDLTDYVSLGGSLHLAKGFAVTRGGLLFPFL